MSTAARLTVGLTGGIASGKSSVTARLRARGIAVLDADEIGHALSGPGQAGALAIATALGPQLLDASGALNRPHLRARLFAEPVLRQQVQDILHPLISSQLQAEARLATGPYLVLAIPLLIEADLRALVHRVLVIDALPATQVQRVMARDGADAAAAERILASQLGRDQRLAVADDVIGNHADLPALHGSVDEMDVFHRRLAATGEPRAGGRRLPHRGWQ